MSPRAACRLTTLGFEEVYDYTAGKVDWLARGLRREGEKATTARVVDYMRDDVVTCGLSDHVGKVRARVEDSPYGFALVVTDGGLLLGRLRRAALEGDPASRAEDVMEPGPSTVRANTAPDKLAERLRAAEPKTAIVTNPDGVLLGVVRTADLEAARD
jgi:CBS domain-containing protein